ncbi:hypothetical protein OF83DRAFT_1081157 [Amylostereum chailletii]|nr:hypothetical protein OF83DRAFT_1081157 [Amylostereum chailletii]
MPPPPPTYPSFTLVLTQAQYVHTLPTHTRPASGPSPRYHPYPRPPHSFDNDVFMTTVDYRQPRNPNHVSTFTSTPSTSSTACFERDSDTSTIESDWIPGAADNLREAVHGEEVPKNPRRRTSLSYLVVDLALAFKAKCKTLVHNSHSDTRGSGGRA